MIYNDKKLCAKCFKEKNLFEFRKKSASKDGRKSYCIACDDADQKLRHEPIRKEKIRIASELKEQNKLLPPKKRGPKKQTVKPSRELRNLRPRMRKARRKYIEERRKIMQESELL